MIHGAPPVEGPRAVRLELPADRSFLLVARSAAAAVGAWAGLSLDCVDDLRMAVWEAGGLVVAAAWPGSSLVVEFTVIAAAVRVTVSAPTTGPIRARGEGPPERAYAWALVESLMDEVTTTWDGERGVTTLQLTIRPRPSTAAPPATAGP